MSATSTAASARAHADGDLVTAGSAPPIANTATIATSSQFDLVDNLDGGVSPRAHVNGRIVTADNAGRHY